MNDDSGTVWEADGAVHGDDDTVHDFSGAVNDDVALYFAIRRIIPAAEMWG